MDDPQMLDCLVEIASETGLEVRVLTSAPSATGELPAQSAVCRVRGRVWVVLAQADPLERRIDVLADALLAHRRAQLEERFLPPAVRVRLDSRGAGSG